MEYDFTYDLYGNPEARLSMGAEAFGRWLSEECSSQAKAAALLDMAQQQRTATRPFTRSSAVATLRIEQGEVTIRAHGDDTAAELAEDFALYDSEADACCGIDDFIELVEAWHEFLN